MRHAGGHGRHVGGALRIARVYPAPAIDENLPADLLGDGGAVLGNRAGLGRGNAGAQIAIGSVLGGNTEPAPPIHAVLFGSIVEPGLADILGCGAQPVIAQRADEIDGPIGVVVSREVLEIAQILGDLAIGLADAVIAPDGGLDRGAEAHADGLANEAGIDLFEDLGFGQHVRLSQIRLQVTAPVTAPAGHSALSFSDQTQFRSRHRARLHQVPIRRE